METRSLVDGMKDMSKAKKIIDVRFLTIPKNEPNFFMIFLKCIVTVTRLQNMWTVPAPDGVNICLRAGV